MNNFPIIPVTKRATSLRRLIYGVGVNDATYLTEVKVDGKRVACPFYVKWKSMLQRSYSSLYQKKMPTYIGCKVCSEWLTFSIFRSWMASQRWEGMQLDKDLLVDGNKTYSPEKCLFISSKLNSLLNDCGSSRGKYKQGVHFKKSHKRYGAECSIEGKKVRLGYFKTEEEASFAYNKFKKEHVINIAMSQSDLKLRQALLTKAKKFN